MVVKPKKVKKLVKKEVGPKIKKVAQKPGKAVKPSGKTAAKTKKAVAPTKRHAFIKPVVTKVELRKEPKLEQVVSLKPVIKEVIKEAAPHPLKTELKVEARPEVKLTPIATVELKELELELPITVKDLAIKLQEKPSIIIKGLMDAKMMVGINQALDEGMVTKICEKYHYKVKKAMNEEEYALSIHQSKDEAKDLKPRSRLLPSWGMLTMVRPPFWTL